MDEVTKAEIKLAVDAAVKAAKDNEIRALKTANWALAGTMLLGMGVGIVRSITGRRASDVTTTA